MILISALLAGCALWALGEAMTLAGGAISPLPGWMATIGLYVAGAGLFALKELPAMGRAGRVGIVLSAFGAFSFATVMTIVLTSGVLGAMAQGAVRHADMVYTPFYLLALVFAVSGLVGFAAHFRNSGGPAWAFWGAAILAALSFARLLLADLPAFHEAVSALVAAYFAGLGLLSARRR